MRWLVALAILLTSAAAHAQSGTVQSFSDELPPKAPVSRPEAAGKNDRRAVADAKAFDLLARWRANWEPVNFSELIKLLQSDNKLDDTEIDLIDELSADSTAVTVSPRSGKGQSIVIGTKESKGAEAVDKAFQEQFEGWWHDGGWRKLVRAAWRSESAHWRVRRFIARKASQAAQESTPANTYKPARELISMLSARNEKLPLPERALGRRLQWEAFVDADRAVEGKLPNVLYSWLGKPLTSE